MRKFKVGDKVNSVVDYADNALFVWPGVVVGLRTTPSGREIAQFLVTKRSDPQQLCIKEWNVRNLVREKPHYRAKGALGIRIGEVIAHRQCGEWKLTKVDSITHYAELITIRGGDKYYTIPAWRLVYVQT